VLLLVRAGAFYGAASLSRFSSAELLAIEGTMRYNGDGLISVSAVKSDNVRVICVERLVSVRTRGTDPAFCLGFHSFFMARP
jgi:hypothetical protein